MLVMSDPTPTERFTAACRMPPFANGTEGEAWMDKWCRYCEHDHAIHSDADPADGCALILNALLGGDWPEAWLPEPDDGEFHLPSRLVCGQFRACLPCGGDPATKEREQRMSDVREYWASIMVVRDV